jgi:hypothetical protein
MKSETLTALAIDRELGELPPETAELFDDYLRSHPEARREAEAMTDAVRAARDAVRRFPDLAPVAIARTGGIRIVGSGPWLARAAAAVLAVGIGVWVGRQTADPGAASARQDSGSRIADSGFNDGPWARYHVAYDARRGAYTLAPHP